MPGTTPIAGLPFMEDHDPLADVAQAIEALALGVDEWAKWTTYTPTLTASSANPTLGTGGSIQGRYRRVDDLYDTEVLLTFGSGMTAGSGVYQFSLPATPASAIRMGLGTAALFDSSSGSARVYPVYWNTAAAVMLNEAGGHVGPANPWAWAPGDTIGLQMKFRAA